ncbi:hypothetical protein C8R46DRAFT_1117603 [Mycena filopes]|nr:hypothetical protein C8R46DRAFT_1117603 [Mycena filopes]
MSSSSYIKRRSRVARRSRAMSIVGLGLTSILEDAEPVVDLSSSSSDAHDQEEEELQHLPQKSNSMKAKRRLGVSDLAIPRTSPLFTAVQGVDADNWQLRLSMVLDDASASKDDTVLDFPHPPVLELPTVDESESSASSSGSSSFSGSDSGAESPTSVSSGLPTPSPSPTVDSYLEAQCVIRCKSIKPLTITKRAVSPVPPVPSSSSISPPSSPTHSQSPSDDEDQWEDDLYYASHARGYITLSPPLPPSFPRRESAFILPSFASTSTSGVPTRAPPPPPIITHSRSSSSLRTLAPRREPPSRPPPRTPVPTDASPSSDSEDYTAEYVDYVVAYAPLLASRSPSPTSSTSRLASLLSPPPPPTPFTPAALTPATPAPAHALFVPHDIDDGDEWDDHSDLEYAAEYEEVPLSPLPLASAPSPPSAAALEIELAVEADDNDEEEHQDDDEFAPTTAPAPTPAPYTGWHPRPRASQLRLAVEPLLATPSPSRYSHHHADSAGSWVSDNDHDGTFTASPVPMTPMTPATPALRSRWSSSTLSSLHSPQAHTPKTFAFARARRYFGPKVKSPASSYKEQQIRPKPMGAASSFVAVPSSPAYSAPRASSTSTSTSTSTSAFASPTTSSKPPKAPTPTKAKKAKTTGGLTAASVRRVLPPSLLLPPSLSMGNAMRDQAYAYDDGEAWIGTRPSAVSVLACGSPDVFASYGEVADEERR